MHAPRASLLRRLCTFAAPALLVAGVLSSPSAQEPASAPSAGPGQDGDVYAASVRPLLQRYCFDCHGAENAKAGVRFDQLDPDMARGGDGDVWAEALELLEWEEMPPDKAERFPSEEERELLMDWMRSTLADAATRRAAERRTVLRRLNREQYSRTLQELLGLGIDFGRRLPADGTSHMGFSNNGEVLRASTLHLESYQDIARAALDEAMALGPRPQPARYRVEFGSGVGVGHVGARTGGYQSVPLNPDDFRVDVLDVDGRLREPSDDAQRAEFDRIRRKVTVGLRGSSQDRFHVVPEGVVLYGALPHREVAPGAWQGPSPNLKLEMQRVFPQEGDFVLRVRASKGYLVSERKELLVALDEPVPLTRVVLPGVDAAQPGGGGVAVAQEEGTGSVDPRDYEPTALGPWFLAGPIPAKTGGEARSTIYVDAPYVDFDAPLRDGETRWRLAGDIDGQVQRYEMDRGVVILARTIHAPSARTMEIAVGSDDACWIWVNGRNVLARDVQRGVAPDQDFVSVDLEAGRNDLVFKVVNDQGGFASYHRLVHDGTRREPAPYEVAAPAGVRVLRADQATGLENLRFDTGRLLAEDFPAPSRARLAVELPAGYWQFDLVHPAMAPDAMGSVRLDIDSLRLDLRPECTQEDVARGLRVTPLGAAYLNGGRRNVTLGGPFFVGFSHLVATPLPGAHPLVERLEAQAETEQSVELPALRAFLGTRTDDGMDYATFDGVRTVDAPLGDARVYEFFGRLENLPIPEPDSGDTEILSGILVAGIWNDHLVKARDDAGPPLLVESLEFEAPYHPVWPPASRVALFHDSPLRGDEEAYTREVLERFLPRAFRRPVEEAEVERYLAYWRLARPGYAQYEHAVRETLVAALCSPSFLFLVEPLDAVDVEGRVSEDVLATRLAYFLWNAPPDAELAALARAGRLRTELVSQVDRMLDDPRSEAFVRAFTREWLRLDRLEGITIDPRRFPAFTRFVKRDMAEETYRFVGHVLREGLPLRTLLAADFTMLNQNLAEFYGIDGVQGVAFRPVPVARESGRGGLLGQGSFLAGHSDGTEPHPIKRAVWVKEKLLGQPPMPPPPNVPDLDPTVPGFEQMTLKERLEQHRDNPSCFECHAGFDPYGIALEDFDAVGRRTAMRKGRPVDASTVLPDGTPVEGADGLRAYLADTVPERFQASVLEHLYAYALGRDTDFADQSALDALADAVAADGDTLRAAVHAVVRSSAFRDR